MPSINIEFPDDVHARLSERAKQKGRSIKKEVVEILRQVLYDYREVNLSKDEYELILRERLADNESQKGEANGEG